MVRRRAYSVTILFCVLIVCAVQLQLQLQQACGTVSCYYLETVYLTSIYSTRHRLQGKGHWQDSGRTAGYESSSENGQVLQVTRRRGTPRALALHDKAHGRPCQLLPSPGAACYPAAEPVCLVHLQQSSGAGAAFGMALIMMCGQPCSGKTTTARRLMSALEERGIAGVLVDHGAVPLPIAQAFAGDCNASLLWICGIDPAW